MIKLQKESKARMTRRAIAPVVEPGLSRREKDIRALRLPFEMRTLAGSQWRVVDEGMGEPLLLLSAYGLTPMSFRHIIAPLARNYRVIVPAYPGWGTPEEADQPFFDYAPEQAAQALIGLCDQLGLGRLRIIAVGEGAAAALYMDRLAPTRVLAATLVSPGGVGRYHPWQMRAMRGEQLGKLFSSMPVSLHRIETWVRANYFDQTKVTPELLEYYALLYRDYSARHAYWEAIQRFDDASLRYAGQELDLSSIDRSIDGEEEPDHMAEVRSLRAMQKTLPLQILHGEFDRWHPWEECPYRKAHPEAEMHVFRNCGSAPYIEKPEEFVLRASEFLE